MSWKSDVHLIVEQICPVGEIFDLEDMYKYNGYLQKSHPNNNHISDKVRQILQQLRDDGIIEFSDNNGCYKRIK